MYIWSKSSSYRVMSHDRLGREDSPSLTLHSARRMTVCGQLVLRDIVPFTITHVSITSADGQALPDGLSAKADFAGTVTFNDGIPYPDPLSAETTVSVKAHVAQSTWITLQADADACPGTYALHVTAHTSLGDFTAEWVYVLHRAILPEPKDSAFGHEYFFNPFSGFPLKDEKVSAPVEPFYNARRYSPAWWDLMTNFAQTMKDLRVNSLHICTLALLRDGGSRRLDSAHWQFNFDLLDQFVEHFMAHGSFRYLAISSEIASVDGGFISSIDEDGKNIRLTLPSPEAEDWAAAFYGGLYAHFQEKGWLPMMLMRLQDEPHTPGFWQWAREKCRIYMPGVPCGEPLDMHSVGRALEGYCDQYIPRLEVYEEGADFYISRQKAGDTVWCYSCCYPEDPWWLNKFIDQPHIYARLIKWVCFTHGITGFLHWGFNYWSGEMYGLMPGARFKGDGFIVYPDPAHHQLLMSARGIATRDGLQDWELLHLLSAKNPATAHAIAARLARSFCDFTAQPAAMDQAVTELLTLLDA